MILSFELTMPNVGSWNGKWTGEGKKYFTHRTVKTEAAAKLLEKRSWYHNFGDGWGARITVEAVTAPERNKRKRKSAGFCGYEWMVDSIIEKGEINK